MKGIKKKIKKLDNVCMGIHFMSVLLPDYDVKNQTSGKPIKQIKMN